MKARFNPYLCNLSFIQLSRHQRAFASWKSVQSKLWKPVLSVPFMQCNIDPIPLKTNSWYPVSFSTVSNPWTSRWTTIPLFCNETVYQEISWRCIPHLHHAMKTTRASVFPGAGPFLFSHKAKREKEDFMMSFLLNSPSPRSLLGFSRQASSFFRHTGIIFLSGFVITICHEPKKNTCRNTATTPSARRAACQIAGRISQTALRGAGNRTGGTGQKSWYTLASRAARGGARTAFKAWNAPDAGMTPLVANFS